MQLGLTGKIALITGGTSGIGLAIAHYRPDVTVTAVELFEATARMAERNARALSLSERFSVVRGDVTKPLFSGEIFDAVVSNPPYIALNEMEGLAPELSHEPRAALTDGGDGLSVIRGVLQTAHDSLRPGGILLMECGAAQGDAVTALARELSFTEICILRDSGGRDRVLSARKSHGISRKGL